MLEITSELTITAVSFVSEQSGAISNQHISCVLSEVVSGVC